MSLQESFLGQPSLSQVFTWQIELQSVFQVFSVLTSPPCSPSVCCSCFCQGLGLLFEQLTFAIVQGSPGARDGGLLFASDLFRENTELNHNMCTSCWMDEWVGSLDEEGEIFKAQCVAVICGSPQLAESVQSVLWAEKDWLLG